VLTPGHIVPGVEEVRPADNAVLALLHTSVGAFDFYMTGLTLVFTGLPSLHRKKTVPMWRR